MDFINTKNFASCQATIVGFGNMGRQYFKALKSLGVKKIRVCSRSENPLKEISDNPGVTTLCGGFSKWNLKAQLAELAIIAVPIADIIPATLHLREWGFKKFLIEKPIALYSQEVQSLTQRFEKDSVDAVCAFNRVAYPSLLKARSLVQREGGITSCTYTFTEFIKGMHEGDYPDEVKKRWGLANSLHVMSMAHALIGWPKEWRCYQGGATVTWHPTGTVFVGSGISERNIPFSYQADWGSTGRWSVEIHTGVSSYRFCPLEKLFQKYSFKEEWQEIPIIPFAPDVKIGFVEQVAGMLSEEVRSHIPLVSLQDTFRLTKYGEEVFGYGA